ncbi:unnamed protein product [Chrysoparadoxa australica]
MLLFLCGITLLAVGGLVEGSVPSSISRPPEGVKVIPQGPPTGVFNPSQRKLPALQLSKKGLSLSGREVSRQALAQELGCPLRDLRLIDPNYPGQFPAILPRGSAVVVAVGDIRAVITCQDLYLFDPDNVAVQGVVTTLIEQFKIAGNTPFEHVCLEVCLGQICSSLSSKVQQLEPQVRAALSDIKIGVGLQRKFERLLPLKNTLDELLNTLGEVRTSVNEVLNNDGDMAHMYLTERSHGRYRKMQNHEEVEMLLENYLMQAMLLESDVTEYLNQIKNTEEFVDIQLDVLRNRILQMELLLELGGFVVASGALVTGVFGMNLLSGLEEHGRMFFLVTAGIYGGILLSMMLAMLGLRRNQLL